ncbi:hypothetical protein LguiA_025070 [Lonicera macranthoides]
MLEGEIPRVVLIQKLLGLASARRRSTERCSESETEGGSSTQTARPSTIRRRSTERRL